MAEKLTKNGISTTKTGEFRCEEFNTWITGKRMVQWDYRDNAGVLHTGIAPSLEKAVEEAQKFGFSL